MADRTPAPVGGDARPDPPRRLAAEPRVRIPETASAGEVIRIKTLVPHPMENGERIDASGERVPRDIINRFSAELDGTVFFEARLEPGVAANPYLEFHVRVQHSGTFRFTWTDDAGAVAVLEQSIRVA